MPFLCLSNNTHDGRFSKATADTSALRSPKRDFRRVHNLSQRFGINIGCNIGGVTNFQQGRIVEHNNIGQDIIQSKRHKYENDDFERVEPEK